jgi:hypothetical protein
MRAFYGILDQIYFHTSKYATFMESKVKDYSDKNRQDEAYEILVSEVREIKSLADSTVISFFSSPMIRHKSVLATFMALSPPPLSSQVFFAE